MEGLYNREEGKAEGRLEYFMRIFFSIMLLCLATACSNPFDTSISVKYEVVGSADTVNITFENGSGGISQMADVALPWSHTFSADMVSEMLLTI